MVAGDFIVVALLDELEDKKATLPARNGIKAVAGLARRAIEAADLVVESMFAKDSKERRGRRSGPMRYGSTLRGIGSRYANPNSTADISARTWTAVLDTSRCMYTESPRKLCDSGN